MPDEFETINKHSPQKGFNLEFDSIVLNSLGDLVVKHIPVSIPEPLWDRGMRLGSKAVRWLGKGAADLSGYAHHIR